MLKKIQQNEVSLQYTLLCSVGILNLMTLRRSKSYLAIMNCIAKQRDLSVFSLYSRWQLDRVII